MFSLYIRIRISGGLSSRNLYVPLDFARIYIEKSLQCPYTSPHIPHAFTYAYAIPRASPEVDRAGIPLADASDDRKNRVVAKVGPIERAAA